MECHKLSVNVCTFVSTAISTGMFFHSQESCTTELETVLGTNVSTPNLLLNVKRQSTNFYVHIRTPTTRIR